MPDLPTGTVTFLYTDIAGSTALWEREPAAMRAAVARQEALLRRAIAAHGGQVFRTVGDGLCAAFTVAPAAVAAALAAQQALVAEPGGAIGPLQVRMALHTSAAEVQAGDYITAGLNRLGRLLAVGHGSQTLLSQTTADLARDVLPPNASLRDLGEHRLRDLLSPEHVFQLLHPALPSDFPALRSLDRLPHNLPRQLTSFVGREHELAEVTRLLGATPLLTLTGSGGCGKTRLARQVAADLIDAYPDGVWLVELAPLADPHLVPQAVARVLGVREQPGQALAETLGDWLASRDLLLVLDNCEHLVDACATLAEALLLACPRLRLLATSRERLGIAGETPWRVPSLRLPDQTGPATVEELVAASDAVQLFAARASNLVPGFTLTAHNAGHVVHICQRLDGIPLAIELAAARLLVLSVEQIAARLDDRFRLLTGGSRTAVPRQQTLRATIDWSHDLLAEPEQVLLRRLAVFAGSWSLEAADAVCSGLAGSVLRPPSSLLDLLGRLVDKSLVQVDWAVDSETRYRLLETIREYAWERLHTAGEAQALRDQHWDWCLALAELAEPELRTPDQLIWLARLVTEYDNLRAALAWCLDTNAEMGVRLAGSLSWFWWVRGDYTEGQRWLEPLLAGTSQPTVERARALHGAGLMARGLGDTALEIKRFEESVALGRERGATHTLAWAVRDLGYTRCRLGEPERGRVLLDEGLALSRLVGDQRGEGVALHFLSEVAMQKHDYQRAHELLEESFVLLRTVGDRWPICNALSCLSLLFQAEEKYEPCRAVLEQALALAQELGSSGRAIDLRLDLGRLAMLVGDSERATWHFEAGLTLAREQNETQGMATALMRLGRLAAFQGDLDRADTRLRESQALLGDRPNDVLRAAILIGQGHVARHRGEPARAVRLQRASLALLRETHDRHAMAECLEALAMALVAEKDPAWAVRLLGAASALRQAVGRPVTLVERPGYDETVRSARAVLGPATFAAGWATGEALSRDQTIAEALASSSPVAPSPLSVTDDVEPASPLTARE